jgi:hypothetical protein
VCKTATLGDELTRKGIRGQIFIVGGAAMAPAYSTRRVTDGAARRLAERRSQGLHAQPRRRPRPIPTIRGIEVSTASPRYLLAMKLVAMRFGEDDEDIMILLRECDIHSAHGALEVLKAMYRRRGRRQRHGSFCKRAAESPIRSYAAVFGCPD